MLHSSGKKQFYKSEKSKLNMYVFNSRLKQNVLIWSFFRFFVTF